MRNDYNNRNCYRGGGIAKRGLGAALRGGGIAKRGMGVALKDGGDVKQDKALIKKAFKMHDMQEHKGEHTDLSKLKKGGEVMKHEHMHKHEHTHRMKKKKGGMAKEESKMHEAKESKKKEMMEESKMKKGGIAKGQKSSAFESGKSGNKPYEAEEAYAKEEGGYKKGGRAMKASGGGLKPVGDLRIPRKIRSSLDYMKKGGRAMKNKGGYC